MAEVKDNQIVTPAASTPAGAQLKSASFGGTERGHGQDRRRFNSDQPAVDKQFDERTLHIDRVARVVKGGRRFRFRALVVVGDHKGKVGVGVAKGADVSSAVAKASDVAKKHFVTASLFKETLPHEAEAKIGGAHVLIKPAREGTGLVSGGAIRTVLEVAGVSNATTKSLGSNNKVNIAYATVRALASLKPASEWITRQNNPANRVAGKPKTTKSVSTAQPSKKEISTAKKSTANKEAKK